ncbi:hypothetical protein O6H91_08G049200 [Diphasiastrum complanatum]|uniref:Uncharacterized protein n=1 Tax=Diphasiastrum complanatum TaxID=34168 RepID=A0ACC2CX83_DIPCM|nr:hypothetical protein O6H91_08G049200 [Diphasiastrum complanatum]
MKVERGTARVVKPSEEAPASLPKLVPLSSSDLVVPRVHVEVLYAFNAPAPPVSLLEHGLAKVVSVYREWAGRLGKDVCGRPAIELNDEGVVFIEAQADGTIQELMPFHPVPFLRDLVPVNRGVPELLLIQVTKFSCGGLTVGVARQHQVADGESASAFMNAWASIVKELSLPFEPVHDRSALMALKKFHFSMEMLQKIKQKAVKESGGFYTTFESLTSHLWRSITEARGVSGEVQTRALVAMNGRKRLDSKFPRKLLWKSTVLCCWSCECGHQEGRQGLHPLSSGFVELQQKNPVQIARSSRTVLTPNLSVTSWVQLPLYQLDFGWGTPVFAGNPGVPFEGIIILTPSYTKDGSCGCNCGLFEPDMAKLEEIHNQL